MGDRRVTATRKGADGNIDALYNSAESWSPRLKSAAISRVGLIPTTQIRSNVLSKATRYKQMCSDRGLRFKTKNGESIAVRIDNEGVISMASRLSSDFGGLGSFEIVGLDPQTAASKKKSFWRGLWNTIKAAAGAILDAITVPVFGYRCRPDIMVDIGGGGISFGISCKEA